MRNNSYFGSIYANIQRKSGQIDSENLDYMSMKLNDITDAFTF